MQGQWQSQQAPWSQQITDQRQHHPPPYPPPTQQMYQPQAYQAQPEPSYPRYAPPHVGSSYQSPVQHMAAYPSQGYAVPHPRPPPQQHYQTYQQQYAGPSMPQQPPPLPPPQQQQQQQQQPSPQQYHFTSPEQPQHTQPQAFSHMISAPTPPHGPALPAVHPPPQQQPPQQHTAPPYQHPQPGAGLPPHEMGLYERLFDEAGGVRNGVVYGREAVEFMGRSGLPKPTLRQIWHLCDPEGRGALSRPQFYLAMRLIAMTQCSMIDPSDPSLPSRLRATDPLAVPIPNLPPVRLDAHLATVQAKHGVQPSIHHTSQSRRLVSPSPALTAIPSPHPIPMSPVAMMATPQSLLPSDAVVVVADIEEEDEFGEFASSSNGPVQGMVQAHFPRPALPVVDTEDDDDFGDFESSAPPPMVEQHVAQPPQQHGQQPPPVPDLVQMTMESSVDRHHDTVLTQEQHSAAAAGDAVPMSSVPSPLVNAVDVKVKSLMESSFMELAVGSKSLNELAFSSTHSSSMSSHFSGGSFVGGAEVQAVVSGLQQHHYQQQHEAGFGGFDKRRAIEDLSRLAALDALSAAQDGRADAKDNEDWDDFHEAPATVMHLEQQRHTQPQHLLPLPELNHTLNTSSMVSSLSFDYAPHLTDGVSGLAPHSVIDSSIATAFSTSSPSPLTKASSTTIPSISSPILHHPVTGGVPSLTSLTESHTAEWAVDDDPFGHPAIPPAEPSPSAQDMLSSPGHSLGQVKKSLLLAEHESVSAASGHVAGAVVSPGRAYLHDNPFAVYEEVLGGRVKAASPAVATPHNGVSSQQQQTPQKEEGEDDDWHDFTGPSSAVPAGPPKQTAVELTPRGQVAHATTTSATTDVAYDPFASPPPVELRSPYAPVAVAAVPTPGRQAENDGGWDAMQGGSAIPPAPATPGVVGDVAVQSSVSMTDPFAGFEDVSASLTPALPSPSSAFSSTAISATTSATTSEPPLTMTMPPAMLFTSETAVISNTEEHNKGDDDDWGEFSQSHAAHVATMVNDVNPAAPTHAESKGAVPSPSSSLPHGLRLSSVWSPAGSEDPWALVGDGGDGAEQSLEHVIEVLLEKGLFEESANLRAYLLAERELKAATIKYEEAKREDRLEEAIAIRSRAKGLEAACAAGRQNEHAWRTAAAHGQAPSTLAELEARVACIDAGRADAFRRRFIDGKPSLRNEAKDDAARVVRRSRQARRCCAMLEGMGGSALTAYPEQWLQFIEACKSKLTQAVGLMTKVAKLREDVRAEVVAAPKVAVFLRAAFEIVRAARLVLASATDALLELVAKEGERVHKLAEELASVAMEAGAELPAVVPSVQEIRSIIADDMTASPDTLDPTLVCNVSLVPLSVAKAVGAPVTYFSGGVYFAPCLNLWLNAVSLEAPQPDTGDSPFA